MKKKIKLTGKQIKLIINVISLGIFAFSYFYIYTGFVAKREAAYTEIDTVKLYMDEREKKLAEEDTIQQKVDDVQAQIKTILDQYPVKIAKEDNYMFIDQLEVALNITFTSTNTTDSSLFYQTSLPIRNADGTEILPEVTDTSTTEAAVTQPPMENETAASLEESLQSDNTNTGDNANKDATVNGTAITNSNTMTGMQTTLTMNFLTTYTGFKNLVEYIKNLPDKTIIDSTSVSMDGSSGDLAGTLVLKRFSLTGTGKTYEPPHIDDINIGTDNIFGTDSGNQ